MQTSTVLLIILAAIVALGLVLFQYFYNSKRSGKLNVFLSFLRFIGLFGLFVLLINPKFSKNEYTIEKTNLVVLTDNSSSIKKSENEALAVLEQIRANSTLLDRFSVRNYAFGNSIEQIDSVSFTKKNTNISKALSELQKIYSNTNSAVILLSDGNSTIGGDYVFRGDNLKSTVYPIALGDTTQYEDIRIDQVNTNKYAFLNNKYPLEVYVSYDGDQDITASINISVNSKSVYRENIKFSSADNSRIISTNIAASSVGNKNINVSVSALENEKNIQNNSRNTVVEVIDEKTNIAIISDVMHPDIGALRKAIESNEQRSVSIQKPNINVKELDDKDVFILYQPGPTFKSIYNYLKQKKASVFTITGANTNWTSINESLRKYRIEPGYPTQDIFGVLNPSFSKFDISNFDMEGFPPLSSDAGPLGISDGETLIQMQIQGRTINSPLLFALDNENGKELVLFGENIWKWRMQSYRNTQNFQNFDDFIGKLMLYLSSSKGKSRLEIDYKSVYEGSTNAKIQASYYDEAFVFNSNASLVLNIKNADSNHLKEIPMLLKNNIYEADLSDILAGQYSFTVSVKDENRSKAGSFTILDFDVEQQFLSTNYRSLGQLASATNGEMYFPNKTENLLQHLVNDNRFVPTQKATKNIVSLIDFRVLLAIIIAALAGEWFIRKYNGLT
ncbi:vWA domain-containing protein [Maribacter sp. 2308TA10-17]|uniref:vWA domain-containing protein n=1 Tax=Maribacter sp. 2308TA10-17 TaxID=3386276 RepID=UPI0039BD0BD5